jgi:hypothetical protein
MDFIINGLLGKKMFSKRRGLLLLKPAEKI